ncbi:SURF1 family protein [Anaerolineales bacterium HSG25]|nr:SURF1 family protein [Anaerolineales bacterium HSG25]
MSISKKLTTPRWMITHFFVLIGLIFLINLGRWQMNRLEERRAYNENVAIALDQPITNLDGSPVEPTQFHFRHVTVSGRFDNSAGMILRNQRSVEGQAGVDLLVPFQITDSDTAVLVNRGWIPHNNSDPSPESRQIYDLNKPITLTGIAYPSQPQPSGFSPRDPELQPGQTRLDGWMRVDINRIQKQVPYPLLDIYIEQIPDDPLKATELPRQDHVGVALDEGPHLSYAMQWFTFAVILVITYAAFVRQEVRKSVD